MCDWGAVARDEAPPAKLMIKGRQCKMDCTPNSQVTSGNWEGSLYQCGVINFQMIVEYPRDTVIGLRVWSKDSRYGKRKVGELIIKG